MVATADEQQRDARDARRAQLMGAAWLALWKREGRGRDEGAGLWIRTDIAPREAPEYEWIWIEPYLTRDADGDLDTYRGQQAGRALLARFVADADFTAAFWFDQAKRVAESTQEEWLFLTGIMQTDGWVQRHATDSNSNTVIVWTKARK